MSKISLYPFQTFIKNPSINCDAFHDISGLLTGETYLPWRSQIFINAPQVIEGWNEQCGELAEQIIEGWNEQCGLYSEQVSERWES